MQKNNILATTENHLDHNPPTVKIDSEGIAAYKTMIKAFAVIAGLWGVVSTATDYIGYSFLQGRIEGLGLGVHELKLSTNETIRQATLAMYEIRQDVLNSLFDTLTMGWFWYLLTGLLGAGIIKMFLKKRQKHITKNTSKIAFFYDTWPTWLQQLAVLPVLVIAFVIYALLVIFTLVNTIWTSLELAHSVGIEKGLADVASPVSKDLAETKATKGLVPSIAEYFDVNNKSYLGKVIFSNNEITILTTKEASYLFNQNKILVAKSIKLDEAKVQNTTPKVEILSKDIE